MTAVSVFLVEPEPLVARSLRRVFEADATIEVRGEAAHPDAPALAEAAADVVLVDVDGLPLTLEEAIAACAHASPQSRVCVLSAQLRVRVMQRALAAKADAYVVRDVSPATLVEVVRTVARGEYYADPRLAGALLRRRSSRVQSSHELSGREHEIVRLIAHGLSNREIGRRLMVSEKTVKNHVSHILAKLQVAARSGVAVYAVRNGLVH